MKIDGKDDTEKIKAFGLESVLRKVAEAAAFKPPEIRFPRRSEDCPAAPVCEAIGNLRKACLKGSDAIGGPGPGICMSSIILLISRIAEMWPDQMVEEMENNRRIGFLIDGEPAPGPESEPDEPPLAAPAKDPGSRGPGSAP